MQDVNKVEIKRIAELFRKENYTNSVNFVAGFVLFEKNCSLEVANEVALRFFSRKEYSTLLNIDDLYEEVVNRREEGKAHE